jgi:hypothetical protein
MAMRHLRDYTLADVHQAEAPDQEVIVPRLAPRTRSKRASRVAAARRCEFCEAWDARLYVLLASPRERRPKDMLVCRFCHIRLVGVVPHRGQLASLVDGSAAVAGDAAPGPAGAS